MPEILQQSMINLNSSGFCNKCKIELPPKEEKTFHMMVSKDREYAHEKMEKKPPTITISQVIFCSACQRKFVGWLQEQRIEYVVEKGTIDKEDV